MSIKTTSIKDVFKQKVADAAEKTTLEACDPTTILVKSISRFYRKDLDKKILRALLSPSISK